MAVEACECLVNMHVDLLVYICGGGRKRGSFLLARHPHASLYGWAATLALQALFNAAIEICNCVVADRAETGPSLHGAEYKEEE